MSYPIMGFLNIAKPTGMTAHDVVARVRMISRIKQVGHGGTLDPSATGVLPVALGKACRLLRFLSTDKIYVAEILLGTVTDTDDLDGQVISSCQILPTESKVQEVLGKFIGELTQVPPLYSAVHHQGQRLYALARAGKPVQDIAARQVTVHSLEILEMALPVVRIRISCGPGTYIRSIARDLGQLLSCGGCLKSLVREQSGRFKLENSISLEQLKQQWDMGQFSSTVLSPLSVLGLDCVELQESQASCLINGQKLPAVSDLVLSSDSNQERVLATCSGQLIAVCRKTSEGRLEPEVVIGNRK